MPQKQPPARIAVSVFAIGRTSSIGVSIGMIAAAFSAALERRRAATWD
jgi:hypothetical protein